MRLFLLPEFPGFTILPKPKVIQLENSAFRFFKEIRF
jgi:hypothetical protein